MSEKPLERLNYYNGQRLEASDLKLEQDYHIRVRRWLNKSLYSAGIARGLEVRAAPGPAVVVSPGLALDADGHEIILWEEHTETVVGDARHHAGTGSDAEVEGLYLTIRYDEELTAVEKDGCETPAPGGAPCRNRLAWGGPGRVRAQPLFAWRDFVPHESSGEIVLALVELDDQCKEVHQINAGVRRYIGAGSASKVRQYALEGERHIDDKNPARIYFHVRGRQPTAVTLYLRAAQFSSLFYSELGNHTHTLDVSVATADGAHRHDLGSGHVTADDDPVHQHAVTDEFIDVGGDGQNMDGLARAGLIALLGPAAAFVDYNTTVNFRRVAIAPQYHFRWTLAGQTIQQGDFPNPVPNDGGVGPLLTGGGAHHHTFGSTPGAPALTKEADDNSKHTHAVTSGAAPSGVSDLQARTPNANTPTVKALTYVDTLQVSIGRNNDQPVNHTPNVLRQLADATPLDWNANSTLGDGKDTHVLKVKGTGAIRLDFLPGVYFTEGEHFIELKLLPKTDAAGRPAPNGGRILYNLYIE